MPALVAVWLTVADLPRPRLILDSAALAGVRCLADASAPCCYGFAPADGYRAALDRARALLEAPPYQYAVTIPAPNGEHDGWPWAYTLSAEPPPRHDESRHYPPWTAMFQERADSITTRLKHFVAGWRLTGDRRFLDAASDIVRCLCAWPQWTDPSYGSSPSCLDTGHCLQMVALYYDWCWADLSEPERRRVREAMVAKGIEPIRATFATLAPYHNFWAVINTGYGQAALALLGDVPEADEWLAEAIANTARQFDSQGGDGGSFEGPMYGTYAADQLAWFIASLDRAGVAHRLAEHPFLRSLPGYAAASLSPHVGGLPTFGDGGWTAGYARTMAMLALRGDETARWYLQESGHLAGMSGLDDLLWLGPLVTAAAPAEPPAELGSAAFADIGYAVLRPRDVAEPFLAFKAGPSEKVVGHNHHDQNSFQITWQSGVLAADPGYRSYFDPAVRRYTVGSVGHNTILIDPDETYLASTEVAAAGHDQVKLAGARLTRLVDAGGIAFVEGEAADSYNPDGRTVLEQFTRRIVYLPGVGHLVRDVLRAPAEHRFGWALHGPPGATFEPRGEGLVLTAGAELRCRVFAPGGVTWRHGDFPGAEAHGPYALAVTSPARETVITSLLAVGACATPILNPSFERGLASWTIRTGDGQGPNHTVTTDAPRAGERCARIDQAGYLYSSRFAPSPGRLTARAWYRSEGGTRGGELIAYFWRDGVSFGNARVAAPPGDAWHEVALEFEAPPETEQICLALQHFDTGVGYWDDVRLDGWRPAADRPTPTVTPLGDGGRDGLDILAGDRRYLVCFGSAGAVASDAAMVVLGGDAAGRVGEVLLDGGTRLALAGRQLLSADRPVTVWIARDAPAAARVWEPTGLRAARLEAGDVGLTVAPAGAVDGELVW